MSDDEQEYDYDYGSDADCGSEDEENDGEGEEGILVENSFYEGEDLKSDPATYGQAIEMFEKVVQMESEKDDSEVKWRFKALQHLVTLYYNMKKYDEMVVKYKDMLKIMHIVVPNERTDAINVILDAISTLSCSNDILSQMYELTLEALKSANNERMWFNTNLKLAKLYIETKEFDRVESSILKMKASCQKPDGSDDMTKGTYLLEVYNLEIQLCAASNDTKRMRGIYPKTLNINAAVSDPRVMGLIREEGGKMYMADRNYIAGLDELNEAFRAYGEAGNARAKTCLKYVILASMLALSDINPLDAQEAIVFKDDKEIQAMAGIRSALESNDLNSFESTLSNPKNHIVDEPFLMKYIDPLRRRMREQVLVNLMKPYKRVTIAFLASELRVSEGELEGILVDMILDAKVMGVRIDQLTGVVLLGCGKESMEEIKLASLRSWADRLENASALSKKATANN